VLTSAASQQAPLKLQSMILCQFHKFLVGQTYGIADDEVRSCLARGESSFSHQNQSVCKNNCSRVNNIPHVALRDPTEEIHIKSERLKITNDQANPENPDD
jgi:hypothetical protein